jgi:diadenylate cyclase
MEWLRVGSELVFLFFLFYPVILSLDGTQGERIIKGYIFFFGLLSPVLLFVTDYLSLHNLKYLLLHFLPIYLLASIVIFQHEIRVALLRTGEMFGKPRGAFEHQKELLAALTYLARRKVGALIALEQNVGLNYYLAQGVPLDAKLSKELLWTIFWPGSPLHDGGVIIQNSRITAARCIFPLSEKLMSATPVGTRHRAAIGVSEVSDAVVLVVSEERGEISLCFKGKLYQNLPMSELEAKLKEIAANYNTLSASPHHTLPGNGPRSR